jgi:glycosyl hydrolase family 99
MQFLPLMFAASLASAPKPLILAHYMPWYSSKPVSGNWGWHWTMNHFHPDQASNGRQDAASKFRPLIGLYDSSDPAVIEYHVLLMKLAGIDGVIIDWYGDQDYYDYATNNANTKRLAKMIEKAGMKFALIYEDQTVTQMIKGGRFTAAQAVQNGNGVMRRLQSGLFRSPAYVRVGGKPLLLVFGPQYYKENDWPAVFQGLSPQPAFYTLMFQRGPAASGAFSWPTPQKGAAYSLKELDMFNDRAKQYGSRIDVAYPRFDDIYKEAGAFSFPPIPDDGGKTFHETYRRAFAAQSPIIQLATWNDWGEGTQIEPSQEFGYRDLETNQVEKKSFSPKFGFTPADLRLPYQLYTLRKKFPGKNAPLDGISRLVIAGQVAKARAALKAFH